MLALFFVYSILFVHCTQQTQFKTMKHLTVQLSLLQPLEGVTRQQMFDTLDAAGYAIPFDIKKMTPWQRMELERQYVQHIERNV